MNFSVAIKVKADLEKCLGVKLAAKVVNLAGEGCQRYPRRVEFCAAKPCFYLDDGQTLKAFAVDLNQGEIIGERYCGSGCSTMNHPEQMSQGEKVKEGFALAFVETYWNGRNMSWNLWIVSDSIQKQIA